jgi:hypothetical protein
LLLLRLWLVNLETMLQSSACEVEVPLLVKKFICLLKIKTFGHVIKYSNTLFHYDTVSDIHLYRLSYVRELDPGATFAVSRARTGADARACCT